MRKRKRRKIFREGKHICLWRRRKTEKEKEGNIWRRKIYFFAEEKKSQKGKGGKYLEKENCNLCGGEQKRRRKRSKMFGEGEFFLGEKEIQRGKRSKIFGEGKNICC